MTDVIPAILAKSFSEIEAKTALVKGLVDIVQIDTCDGRFADNILWPYIKKGEVGDADFKEIVAEKKGLPFWEELEYEFDLMVREPEGIIGDFVRAGATRLLIHLESTKQMGDIIAEWKDAVELGIALKPKTPLSELDSFMHEVKTVQFMGSDYIGHAGVQLDPALFDRIREFKQKYPEHTVSVDIGVNLETAPDLLLAGADHLVAGSAIFKADDPVLAIKRFQDLL